MATVTEKTKDLLKMLGGTIAVVVAAVWVLSIELKSITTELHSMENRLNEKIAGLDKRITIVEMRIEFIERILENRGMNVALNTKDINGKSRS